MTGITFQFLGDDFEREVPNTPVAAQETPAPQVEIFHSGTRRLLFVNGVAVRQVLSIDTPRVQGGLAGVVNLSFVASEIVEREVSRESFEKLRHCATLPQIRQGLHQGEAIIPAPQVRLRAFRTGRGYKFFERSGDGLTELCGVVGLDEDGRTLWVDAEKHNLGNCGVYDWGVPVAPIRFKEVAHLKGPKQVICYGRES